MKKIVLSLALIYISTSIVQGVGVNSPCGDWIPYKDEKCVKLFTSFKTRHRAEEACNRQDSTLITIKSAIEQKFLIEYVFNSSNSNNVWIGAGRKLDNSTQFDWSDGTPVQRFSNWAKGRPSNDVRRPCVHMHSPLSRNLREMDWIDVSCTIGNWYLCQKLQVWPIERVQLAILNNKREVQYLFDTFTKLMIDRATQLHSLTNQMTDMRNTITAQTTQLKVLQANPVPLGFVYVQLPNQPEPRNIWGTVAWIEITSEYAGLFFRAEGGDSAVFGTIQAENSPRLTRVGNAVVAKRGVGLVTVNANGAASLAVSTGTSTMNSHWGLTFTVSSGEVRPRNQAIRIWKRI